MDMETGIIYKAHNPINGKCYIGQTIHSLTKRMNDHKSSSKAKDYHFYYAIRKYGFDTFEWEVLKTAPVEELSKWEMYYIGLYDSYNNGYNSTLGGEGTRYKSKYEDIIVTLYHWYGKVYNGSLKDFFDKYDEKRAILNVYKQLKSGHTYERQAHAYGWSFEKWPTYTLYHIDGSILEDKTVKQLSEIFGIKYEKMNSALSKAKTYKGWYLEKPDYYTFYHPEYGYERNKAIRYMNEEYSKRSRFGELAYGRKNSYKDWVLIKEED